jgi:hypothetical protein
MATAAMIRKVPVKSRCFRLPELTDAVSGGMTSVRLFMVRLPIEIGICHLGAKSSDSVRRYCDTLRLSRTRHCITSFNLRTKPGYDRVTITHRLGEPLPKESENPAWGCGVFFHKRAWGNTARPHLVCGIWQKVQRRSNLPEPRHGLQKADGGRLLTAQPFPAVNLPRPLG